MAAASASTRSRSRLTAASGFEPGAFAFCGRLGFRPFAFKALPCFGFEPFAFFPRRRFEAFAFLLLRGFEAVALLFLRGLLREALALFLRRRFGFEPFTFTRGCGLSLAPHAFFPRGLFGFEPLLFLLSGRFRFEALLLLLCRRIGCQPLLLRGFFRAPGFIGQALLFFFGDHGKRLRRHQRFPRRLWLFLLVGPLSRRTASLAGRIAAPPLER